MTIEYRVKEIIAKSLDKSYDDIGNEDLLNELGFDSMALVRFIMYLEDEFQLQFSEFAEITMHLQSVESLILYIKQFLEANSDV